MMWSNVGVCDMGYNVDHRIWKLVYINQCLKTVSIRYERNLQRRAGIDPSELSTLRGNPFTSQVKHVFVSHNRHCLCSHYKSNSHLYLFYFHLQLWCWKACRRHCSLLLPSQSHAVVLKNSTTMSNRPLQTVPQRLSIKMVNSMPKKQPRVHSDADKISSTQNVSVSLLCAVVDGLIFYNSPLKPTRNATSSLCCPKSCASHQCHHSLQLLYIPRCSSTLFPVNYSEFWEIQGCVPFHTACRHCDAYHSVWSLL